MLLSQEDNSLLSNPKPTVLSGGSVRCHPVILECTSRIPGTAVVIPYIGFKGDITSRNTLSCLLNYSVSTLALGKV